MGRKVGLLGEWKVIIPYLNNNNQDSVQAVLVCICKLCFALPLEAPSSQLREKCLVYEVFLYRTGTSSSLQNSSEVAAAFKYPLHWTSNPKGPQRHSTGIPIFALNEVDPGTTPCHSHLYREGLLAQPGVIPELRVQIKEKSLLIRKPKTFFKEMNERLLRFRWNNTKPYYP